MKLRARKAIPWLVAVLWLAPARAGGAGVKPLAAQLDLGAIYFSEAGFAHGARFAAGLFLRTGRRTGVEVILEHGHVPVAEGAGGEARLVAGRMEVTALGIDLHTRFLRRGRVHPFALIGVGFFSLGFFADDPAAAPAIDLVDRLALQWGGGIELCLSSRLALCARVRCSMVNTWVQDLPRTAPLRETDALAQNLLQLHGTDLSLGVRFSL
jgi:hypothetical protein